VGVASWISAVVLAACCVAPAAAQSSGPKFGALAVDRAQSFVFGFSHDYPTRAEAERRALEEARNRGGSPTVVLVWSGAGCGAYRTVDAKDGDAYGWGVARTRAEADAIAQREATKRSNGNPTWNNAWACNSDTPEPLAILKNEPVGEAGGEGVVLQNNRYVTDIAFSPDGRQVATLSYGDGAVMVWEVRTGRLLRTLTGLSPTPYSIAWSPDGARIAGGDGQRVILWDARNGQKLGENVHKSLLSDLAFTAGGLFANGAQEVYDNPSGGWVVWQLDPANVSLVRKVTLVDPHTHALDDTVFSPDGRLAATLGNKAGLNIRIWDLATGRPAVTVAAPRDHRSAEFSPDGTRLATGGDDGVAVWDVASGRQLVRFGSGVIDDVAFSPDGRRIVSGHMNNAVTVWDAATGQQLARMTGHAKRALAVAFSPDGRVVASGSEDGTARLWDAAAGAPMKAAKGAAPAAVGSRPTPAPKPAPAAKPSPPATPKPARNEPSIPAPEPAVDESQAEQARRLNAEVAARAAAVDARNKAAADAYAAKEAAFNAATAKYEQDKAAYEAEAARAKAAQEQYARDKAAYEEKLKALEPSRPR
jgi:WD40 repeat protein